MASTSKKNSASTTKKATTSKVTAPQESVSKATASKATANKKTTTRKSAPIDKETIVQSVVFTKTKSDQELLEAIEQELEAAAFSSFDELCKEALYQFLWEEESQSIQPQLDQLEESIAAKNAAAFKQLGQQIRQIIPTIEEVTHPLSEQIEQLQAQVEALQQQLACEPEDFTIVPPVERPEESTIESIEIVQPVVKTIELEHDPFFDRLSALLEDF